MSKPNENAFPENRWEELKALMEAEGTECVIARIAAHGDPAERRKLFGFARRAFSGRDWEGKNLDALVATAEAGIAEIVRQADVEESVDGRASLLDEANVLAYNFAADLAPCWPGDDAAREPRHLEAGLRAADRCVAWRKELGKGPWPHSIAHWARGIHQTALGRAAEGAASFRRAYTFALQHGAGEGTPPEQLVDVCHRSS